MLDWETWLRHANPDDLVEVTEMLVKFKTTSDISEEMVFRGLLSIANEFKRRQRVTLLRNCPAASEDAHSPYETLSDLALGSLGLLLTLVITSLVMA